MSKNRRKAAIKHFLHGPHFDPYELRTPELNRVKHELNEIHHTTGLSDENSGFQEGFNDEKLEKLICGSVNLYRLKCPRCGEFNLSGNMKFHCTACDIFYKEKKIDKVRVVSDKKHRRLISDELFESLKIKQGNKCYYCEREFGRFYRHKGKPKINPLKPIADPLVPFEIIENDPANCWVLMCNVCDAFRGKKQFQSTLELKQWLRYIWAKKIDLGRLIYY